ncbi:MAG: sigma-54-dependent Fis family transcriptional regulator [Deltaproteobacteria bacterium]|nr:sigma-54-dependent Fis family transcriptional regulator [Deltaproteobacteria bacterium]
MKVLIVDDDPNTRYLIETFCRGEDYELLIAPGGKEAIDLVELGGVNVVITDIRMPEVDGQGVLDAVRRINPEIPVIIMTSYGSIEDAVHFLQSGAHDYITKPLTKEVFCHRVQRALEKLHMSRQISRLHASLKIYTDREHVVGNSRAMRSVIEKLPSIAQTDASVVIYGESGTGKELVARTIHYFSKRANKPFVPVNCGALPENLLESELFGYKRGAFTDAHADTPGLVEEANTGTLFLDEVGEVSPRVQVKLLRFLQEKEIKPLGSTKILRADVRIISATNKDLKAAIEKGEFRDDLYYRLNIVPILIPPLRERKEDIPLLANHFLRKFARDYKREDVELSPLALQKLVGYDWPGNIRELENKIQQTLVVTTGDVIRPEEIDVPGESRTFKAEKRKVVGEFEQNYVSKMLSFHRGNISRAAKAAGMDRKNFWQLMKKYRIEARAFNES